MTLWFIIAGITALVALAVLIPLSHGSALTQTPSLEDAGVYQAQLNDIDRDAKRGLLGSNEAEALRNEAARRLLRANQAMVPPRAEGNAPLFRRRFAALMIALVMPLGGLGVYLKLGSPHMPDMPLAARNLASPENMDVQKALAKIERHLATAPGDLRGWDLIAPIYLRLGRPVDAARAFQAAINNGGANVERWASLGEALMMAAEGMVTTNARIAFETALTLEADHPKASYGLAMAKQQDGNPRGAINDLEALIARSPKDADYMPLLRQSLATLQVGNESGAAIAALAESERNAAIRAMVEGLAERLKPGGGTVEEWQRLIRARVVLGDKGAAEAALATARERLAGDVTAMGALVSIASDLGIEGRP